MVFYDLCVGCMNFKYVMFNKCLENYNEKFIGFIIVWFNFKMMIFYYYLTDLFEIDFIL